MVLWWSDSPQKVRKMFGYCHREPTLDETFPQVRAVCPTLVKVANGAG
jgi:hypothetical protein